MRIEHHTFPATSSPLDSYLENCAHSRPAYQFLLHHMGELGDEFSCVLLWQTADDEKRYAWCYLQRVHSDYIVRVVHLDGEPEVALKAPVALYNDPTDEVLNRALDVLDDMNAVPPQARLDLVRYVKAACDEQLLEVTIAELTAVRFDELQVKKAMLHELQAYCNALGA